MTELGVALFLVGLVLSIPLIWGQYRDGRNAFAGIVIALALSLMVAGVFVTAWGVW